MELKQNLKSIGINIASVALAVAIGIPLGIYIINQLRPLPSTTAPVSVSIALAESNLLFKNVPADLIVFGDTKCMYCKEGVQLLDNLGASYQLYNIDQDAKAMKVYKSLKTGGVPVLISRQHYMTGYNKLEWEGFLKGVRSKQALTSN